MAAFPGAQIAQLRPIVPDGALTAEALAAVEALPEVEDEWDPFEED